MTNDFLVELGCEELPPKAMQTLVSAFAKGIEEGLKKEALSYESILTFVSPRRLAVKVLALAPSQENKQVVKKGPSISAAYDEQGEPSGALKGFARSCKVDLSKLTTLKENKGEWLAYECMQEGKKSVSLLPSIVSTSIKKLPIPKPMRWGNSKVQFVRPVHWLVMMLGKELVPANILDLEADRYTYGHRFHQPERIELSHVDEYETCLENAFVIASFAKRRAIIETQINQCANACNGFLVENSSLLDEVTGIVEWPNAVLVPFDNTFLEVPKEALIESMASHQKCFSLNNDADDLLPFFITVANIEPKSNTSIINGNEKVMRARLSDAMFFYENDKKTTLSHKADALKRVVFQKELGTVQEKVDRVSFVATFSAKLIELDESTIRRAAMLSKASLMTEMVGEFPSLQDVMGYYYALHDGETVEVATALQEHYLPRFSGDVLPKTKAGAVLAIADRIDTLVGIFGINQKPTGVKDPFQLRRLSLGVIRILIDGEYNLTLNSLLEASLKSFIVDVPNQAVIQELMQFFSDRLYAYLTGPLKVRPDIAKAVSATQNDTPLNDVLKRCKALESFVRSEHSSALIQGFKRVSNILKGTDLERLNDVTINPDLLQTAQEKTLFKAIESQQIKVKKLISTQNYDELLLNLTRLKEPVDDFFEHVMVNTDDPALKQNRIRMLAQLEQLFTQCADLSLIQES